jgi:glycosyltransferase involved in cell wall biosynthesis
MKFSVIITTLNRANIIPMCMDSLISQNFPKSDYEIIIINNSTDNTEEVIEKYIEDYPEVNIKYYYIPKPGQVYARQIGILAAQNEILSFTDDDAILCPDWLKEINNVFELNNEVAGVAGKIKIKWDETPPEWIHEYENFLGKLNYGDEIKYEKGLYMNAGNLHIKKDILIDVGGFNPEMVGEWLMGDGETGLWVRLKKYNHIIGWAPKAIMEHYQIAKKNATVGDIKRRFMNNGICIPYNIYAIDKKGYRALIWNMVLALKQTS